MLAIPAFVRPWKQNTNRPMGLDAFVQGLYVKSAWTEEESLLAGHGFESGAIEGWTNPHCSQQEITIARFATSLGAQGQLKDLTRTWRSQPKPTRTFAYVGGLGWVNPTPDSEGNARVEIAVCDGDLVIVVMEFTLRPDITAAVDLMLAQYDSL